MTVITTEDTKTNQDYMTVHEVAKLLRVDDTTVRRWIKSRALPALTLPHLGKRRSYRVAIEDYNKLVNGELPSLPVSE